MVFIGLLKNPASKRRSASPSKVAKKSKNLQKKSAPATGFKGLKVLKDLKATAAIAGLSDSEKNATFAVRIKKRSYGLFQQIFLQRKEGDARQRS